MSGTGEPGGNGPGSGGGDNQSPDGSHAAWSIVSYLLSGVLVWGGVGWLLDRWLGTAVFVPIGILLGFGAAFYLIIRRYGDV